LACDAHHRRSTRSTSRCTTISSISSKRSTPTILKVRDSSKRDRLLSLSLWRGESSSRFGKPRWIEAATRLIHNVSQHCWLRADARRVGRVRFGLRLHSPADKSHLWSAGGSCVPDRWRCSLADCLFCRARGPSRRLAETIFMAKCGGMAGLIGVIPDSDSTLRRHFVPASVMHSQDATATNSSRSDGLPRQGRRHFNAAIVGGTLSLRRHPKRGPNPGNAAWGRAGDFERGLGRQARTCSK